MVKNTSEVRFQKEEDCLMDKVKQLQNEAEIVLKIILATVFDDIQTRYPDISSLKAFREKYPDVYGAAGLDGEEYEDAVFCFIFLTNPGYRIASDFSTFFAERNCNYLRDWGWEEEVIILKLVQDMAPEFGLEARDCSDEFMKGVLFIKNI